MIDSSPLWIPSPDRIAASAYDGFRRAAEAQSGTSLPAYGQLHRWSIEDPAAFWNLVWDFCGVVGDKGTRTLIDAERMPGAAFFPDARLNFAENLLSHPGRGDAIVYRGEDGSERRLSWEALSALVSRLQQYFASIDVAAGDRIAAMMPNVPETVAAMLAAASLGAVWSSCSPDFGENAVLDRFGQIAPVVLIVSDGYRYGGKSIDLAEKTAAVATKIPSLKAVLVVDHMGCATPFAAGIDKAVTMDKAAERFMPRRLFFERLPFAHPLYILFSSGTTGAPKCIVHSAGGTLLQHLKEHRLHVDLRPDDRLFYFTTCGWMMWNWLASGLASGATIVLYDGSPFHPDGNVLFDLAAAESVTHFGTSAKFIETVRKSGLEPRYTHDLSSLRSIFSTGSPLSVEGFRFVYDGIKQDVHLASVSGGTDILSCFVLGVPDRPVRAGEIQGPGLGMAVDVWDDTGQTVRGEKGELVCRKAFPSMPIGFWNDPGDTKYLEAYFARFTGIWCHGDFAEWTEHDGIVIHGRSDTTLNPGGVRIGTAEIYNQLEQMPEIAEALCIGQDVDGDVRIVLFVRLLPDVCLDSTLETRIRHAIRSGASPRHVPAKIVAVADVPRTRSGKISETAVRDVVHGRTVSNADSLTNPEALQLYRNLPELAV